MIPLNLNYNYKDIFLAPRLALSGKKIFLILKGNLVGYIAYFFFFSYVALITNGMGIEKIVINMDYILTSLVTKQSGILGLFILLELQFGYLPYC